MSHNYISYTPRHLHNKYSQIKAYPKRHEKLYNQIMYSTKKGNGRNYILQFVAHLGIALLSICVCVCVRARVCVCEREREEEGGRE